MGLYTHIIRSLAPKSEGIHNTCDLQWNCMMLLAMQHSPPTPLVTVEDIVGNSLHTVGLYQSHGKCLIAFLPENQLYTYMQHFLTSIIPIEFLVSLTYVLCL